MKKHFGVIALLSIPAFAVAEGGCPPGYYPHNVPGLRGCAPIPGYYSPSNQQVPLPVMEPPIPRKWGSIAVDSAKQVAGFSKGMDTDSQAEKAAIKDCKYRGGKNCKLEAKYSNQCVGMVVGENSIFRTALAETEGKALHFARTICEYESGVRCQIYYAGCSFANRVN